MSVKAVAFDIDGTLYPNRSMYFHSLPFYLSHFRKVSAFSRMRREIRDITPVEDFETLQADLLSRDMGISREEAGRMIREVFYGKWENIFRRVKPFPGVRDVLLSFREKGLRTAALSDFPVGNKLEYFGLADCWDLVMSSNESGYLKPGREPFLELARRLELEPAEILYVGNNFEYDVMGSRGAGMKAAWIAPSWKRARREADFQFSRYSRLAEYVEGLLSP